MTLRIVAEHAHIWNALGDPEQAGRKNRILDEWCQKVGRDPKEIERSVNLRPHQVRTVDRYIENGITQPHDRDRRLGLGSEPVERADLLARRVPQAPPRNR